MGPTPPRQPGPLNGLERIAVALVAVILAGIVVYYLVHPPTTTKTTTERDAQQTVTKTTVEEQAQVGEAILLGGFGFAAILGLTALRNGRLKFTGPGGSGVEAATAAVAAAADATMTPLMREHERLRGELQAEGKSVELDPEVQEAVARWNDVKMQIFGHPEDDV
jgi:hypothetical protein